MDSLESSRVWGLSSWNLFACSLDKHRGLLCNLTDQALDLRRRPRHSVGEALTKATRSTGGRENPEARKSREEKEGAWRPSGPTPTLHTQDGNP